MSELLMKKKNGYLIAPADEQAAQEYCEGYKDFLNKGKIERFCVEESVRIASEAGFKPFEYGKSYVPGDKIYYVQHDRAVIFAVIGAKGASEGFNITAASANINGLLCLWLFAAWSASGTENRYGWRSVTIPKIPCSIFPICCPTWQRIRRKLPGKT